MQTKINHERREKIRKELEEQIQRRKIKNAQEQQEKKQEVVEAIFDEDIRSKARIAYEDNYRRDLTKQIMEDRDRKKQE